MQVHVDCSSESVDKVYNALKSAFEVYKTIREQSCKGYITYKEDTRADGEKIQTYQDYHPYLFSQCTSGLYKEFSSFSEAIDDFYSNMDEQKQVIFYLKIFMKFYRTNGRLIWRRRL